jgi:hypothetical protein
MTGCATDEAAHLLQELEDAGVCSRTEHGIYYSRRMVRDEKTRQLGRDRVQKHRERYVTPPVTHDVTQSVTQMKQPSSSSSSSSTTKKEQIPSRGKREVDPRHVPFRLACETYMTFRRATFVWDASEAKALDLLLKACPALTLSQFQTCLNHRGKSPGVPHGERPRIWLPNVLKYQESPLNEFGKTGASNGSRNQSKTGGNLNAAEQAIAFLAKAERDREAADDVQPEAPGGGEPGDIGLVRVGTDACGTGGLGKCLEGTLSPTAP